MCDFAAILNAFRDHSETAHDTRTPTATQTPAAIRTPTARRTKVACLARIPGPILEGARVSNAAAHTCAAAAGFFFCAHTGSYPEYLYSYRYL